MSIFSVDAGVTVRAPWRNTTVPSESWATSTATCRPSRLSASSFASARRTASPSTDPSGVGAATSATGFAAGSVSPGGGRTWAGWVTGEG